MTPQSNPRPATELFPESLRLSPKQREVLTTLQTFPEGARAVDVAAALGMHVNTARGHLDELVNRDAVRVFTAPAQGRGRPSLIFQVRVPDNRSIANEYVSLIEVLAAALNEVDEVTPAARGQAREIGRKWARQMQAEGREWTNVEEMLSPLYLKLRDMGFDPSIDPSRETGDGGTTTDVHLHSCPFIVGSERPSIFVCAIHEGFIQEAMGDTGLPDASGRVHLTLRPFAGEDSCIVSVEETPESPETTPEPPANETGQVIERIDLENHPGPGQKTA
ncbi:helix-turn-helix transcriptional regulator [Corynebacterium halotolerans]|uniref:Transcriptional regulator n=1 Tax=Corynebacterium halotolerans YIM 70093 = DSM 44683 TaxID=1121362 RepID=M1P6B8_9CORY|nr:hypothetical protein [Corynebacterium halotolerans]AGF72211.1 hypothetical protein A605_06025 [Corynebacterium halotolerans YIM 70093 = DSM 44683]